MVHVHLFLTILVMAPHYIQGLVKMANLLQLPFICSINWFHRKTRKSSHVSWTNLPW